MKCLENAVMHCRYNNLQKNGPVIGHIIHHAESDQRFPESFLDANVIRPVDVCISVFSKFELFAQRIRTRKRIKTESLTLFRLLEFGLLYHQKLTRNLHTYISISPKIQPSSSPRKLIRAHRSSDSSRRLHVLHLQPRLPYPVQRMKNSHTMVWPTQPFN